ncbi:response regulator [Maricaulis sp.]|uniref:response regulator n=1 Tax=Maricaulis sp. TaxID=1486257 RepID=UPI0026388B03|nr:response regulator [Maricaulis sp.]
MTVRLAVVDNNPSMREFIAEVSNELGFETRLYASGDAFLDGDGDEADIILLDILMPGRGGLEVIHELANRQSQARIYLLSSLDSADLKAMRNAGRARELRMQGIITKPLRAASLRKTLSAMMA